MRLYRPFVSQGGLKLTTIGFKDHVAEDALLPLSKRYLLHYRQILADRSCLFEGFEEILETYESNNIPWGIVTNKPEWLTTPLLSALKLDSRSAITLSGDSLAERKPHPLPLIHAAKELNVNPQSCVYVGDDKRDIDSGNGAMMSTLIANWGYLGEDSHPDSWNANDSIDNPHDLLTHPLSKL